MESEESKSGKHIWSRDDLVKLTEATPEELEYRKEKSQEPDFVEKYSKLFKCTKCQLNLKSVIMTEEKVPIHPCLGVLMCRSCCDYYEDGEFSLDSDGEDKYCRWCGEGGTIFSCSKCICGFCVACIKRHFKLKYYKKVQQDENWLCFFCDTKPLWDKRFICSLAVQLSKSIESGIVSSPNKYKEKIIDSPKGDTESEIQEIEVESSNEKHITRRVKRKSSKVTSSDKDKSSCSNSDLKSDENEKNQSSNSHSSKLEIPLKKVKFCSTPIKKDKKSSTSSRTSQSNNPLSELNKILVLTQQQMDLGMNWSKNRIEQLKSNSIESNTELQKQCQHTKWFLSTMSTYLIQSVNSVTRIEKEILTNTESQSPQDTPKEEQSEYSKILQFLNFMSNQVKIFMEKGFSLPDILEAEVLDDEKIIGIKKRQIPSKETSMQEISNTPGSSNLKNKMSNTGTKKTQKDLLNGSENETLNSVVGNVTEKDSLMEVTNEDQDGNSSNTTSGEVNYATVTDNEDIQDILAILEHA